MIINEIMMWIRRYIQHFGKFKPAKCHCSKKLFKTIAETEKRILIGFTVHANQLKNSELTQNGKVSFFVTS